MGCSQARATQACQQMQTCPQVSRAEGATQENKNSVLEEQLTHLRSHWCTKYIHALFWLNKGKTPRWPAYKQRFQREICVQSTCHSKLGRQEGRKEAGPF